MKHRTEESRHPAHEYLQRLHFATLRPTDATEGSWHMRYTRVRRRTAVALRDLFAEVLARHLGAGGLEHVFPGHPVNAEGFPGVMRG